MAVYGGPEIATSGLILCLDAGNTKSYAGSGITWVDLSGSGYNGTLTNGPTFSSNNKGNIVFDGTNDYIQLPFNRPSPTTQPTTYEIVFKNNSSTNAKYLIGASNYNISGFAVGLYGLSTIAITYFASGVNGESTHSYDSSVINHGIFNFDGRSVKIYRNSVLLHTSNKAFDATDFSSNIRIANFYQGGWTHGQIDVYFTRVYNRTLSVSEIKQNYNALKGRFGL